MATAIMAEAEETTTKWRLTDEQAAMVEENRALVHYYAGRRYGGKHPLFDDILQAGMLGLMRAAVKFDLARGIKFGTYAMLWIRQSIDRFLWSDTLIHIPCHASYPGSKFAGEAAAARAVVSIDERNDHGEPFREPAAAEVDQESDHETDEKLRRLAKAMECLDDRDRAVLVWRSEERTYKAIGDSIGVSMEGARHIHARAEDRLRKLLGVDQKEAS